MKAKINGIEVEGTPSELVDYVKRMDDLRRENIHIKPPLGKMPDWIKTGNDPYASKPIITCAIIKGPNGCHAAQNGGCNCTGACM